MKARFAIDGVRALKVFDLVVPDGKLTACHDAGIKSFQRDQRIVDNRVENRDLDVDVGEPLHAALISCAAKDADGEQAIFMEVLTHAIEDVQRAHGLEPLEFLGGELEQAHVERDADTLNHGDYLWELELRKKTFFPMNL